MSGNGPVPGVPGGWLVEASQAPAEGEVGSGDVIRGVVRDDVLDLVLADVSGHGDAAAAAAGRLDAVLQGLLEETRSADVFEVATARLHDEDWGARFATAVHVAVDLASGDYEIRGAGHPPPVRRKAETGRWRLLDPGGPVLGLLPEAWYGAVTGRLDRGDALLVYTDGVVEQPQRNIERGIVVLLRAAEEQCRQGFDGLTERLLDGVGRTDDDRALALIHRR